MNDQQPGGLEQQGHQPRASEQQAQEDQRAQQEQRALEQRALEQRRLPVGLVLAVILGLGAVLRLFGLGDQPFWLDEAHTANFTKLPLGELWSFSDPFDTVNPPGFILIMKIWTQVARTDEWFRMLSALAGIATIPIVHAVGARMGSRRAGLFAALFLAISGYHVRYSQEARAYALITLMAAVALWAVTQLVSEPDGETATPVRRAAGRRTLPKPGRRRPLTWTDAAWVSYGLAVGVSLHLHNTAIAIPMAANLSVAIWWLTTRPRTPRFARNWVGANLLAVVVWSPWLPGFLTQLGLVQQNFWVPQPTVGSVTRDLGVLIDAYAGLLIPAMEQLWFHAAVLVAAAAVMWWGTRAVDRKYRYILWSFVLVAPVFELLFSLRQPVFLSRTLLWILLGFAVALGLAFDRAVGSAGRHTGARRSHVGWIVVTSSILVVAALSAIGYHTSFEKTAWDQAAALVAEGAGSDDVVLVLAGNTLVAFNRYFDNYDLDIPRYSIPFRIPDRSSQGSVLTTDDTNRILDLVRQHGRTWLVLNSVANVEAGDTLQISLENTLEVVDDVRLNDLRVIVYE